MRGKTVFLCVLLLLTLLGAARAGERRIVARTQVTKWGQMPLRFEIQGQSLPEGVTGADFAIEGQANGWNTSSWHPFQCGAKAVEATEDGWALIPERFPDKYFFVQRMLVSCASHPELGFALEDISETVTPTADAFEDVEVVKGRVSAHVFTPEAPGPLPLVLVFHGYGDTDNLLTYRTAVAWAEPESQATRPCTVVAPSIITTYYGSEVARYRIYEGIMAYIDGLIDAGRVDPKRVYVMGNSFGGMASFEIAAEYPGRFAAILALCPALNYSPKGSAALPTLTDIPVFIAQAEGDETIPVQVGRQAAEALKAAGNPCVRLRVYTDAEMNACGAVHGQAETYSFHHVELAVMEDEAYAEWLFSQSLD